jgi:DNA-binding NtrC family response regulator
MNSKNDFKILVVDDETWMSEGIKKALNLEGFPVDTAESGMEAVKMMRNGEYRLAFVDLKLPDIDGVEVVRSAKTENLVIVIITAFATVETAVNAMKCGAEDYIKKPFDISDIIEIAERFYLKAMFQKPDKKEIINLYEIIYKSKELKEINEKVRKIKDWDMPVLILGESGTGKEMIARTIHYSGSRSAKPFVAVNCAAIPQDLMESELFGHEKGAFTGAAQRKPGRFELAGDGILYLDEIGDMNISLQAKLLRAIEAKVFEPVGSVKPVEFRARILASTNQNLMDLIRQKKFREDLYYRLNGVKITIPPLRERLEDIEVLIEYFKSKFEALYRKEKISISTEAVRCLKNYSWTGNVRELKNVIESAILLAGPKNILFPEDFSIDFSLGNDFYSELDDMEKQNILEALSSNRFNRSLAAEALKISRKTLYNKMKKYSL